MAGTSPAMTNFDHFPSIFSNSHSFTFPRCDSPRLCQRIVPRKIEGAGNAGCQAHPQPRMRNKKAHELVTTGSPKHSGIPCANGFNGLFRALPGDRACCHRRRRDCRSIVAGLISASRYQDHAALPSALVRSSSAPRRPSHPAPHVRDDRETPLLWARNARKTARDLPDDASKMSCGTLARRANQAFHPSPLRGPRRAKLALEVGRAKARTGWGLRRRPQFKPSPTRLIVRSRAR
jgi:hypothetical protein